MLATEEFSRAGYNVSEVPLLACARSPRSASSPPLAPPPNTRGLRPIRGSDALEARGRGLRDGRGAEEKQSH